MRKWLGSFAAGFAVVLGCATTSQDNMPPDQNLLPPAFSVESVKDRQALDYFLLKMADSSGEKRVQWWVEYRRAALWAETDPKLACGKWRALATDLEFPIHHLANVRARTACAQALEPVGLEPVAPSDSPPWLESARLDSLLAEARAAKDWQREYELLIEQSKVSIDPDTKLNLVEDALKIAATNKDAAKIEAAVARREKLAPRYKRDPKPHDWIIMAHDLRRARKFKSARNLFKKASEHKKLDQARRLSALRGMAQVYKLERDKKNHVKILRKVVTQTKPQGKRKTRAAWRAHYDAVINLARAQWTNGDVSGARKLLKASLKTFNKHLPRTELFWLLGRMDEEKGAFASAIEQFKRGDAESDTPSEMNEKVLWYLGWNHRKLGNWPEAIAALDEGRKTSLNEFSRSRFLYWLARSHKDSGRDEAATVALYEELIKADPLGYYGLLAHKDLNRPIRRATAPPKVPKEPSRLKDFMDLRAFEWLVSVEEFDIAQLMLDQTADSLKRNSTEADNETTWSDLFNAYARAGAYQHLYERLGRISADQRQSILNQNPELLFPQPYRESVTAAAERYGLPPELLFAVMRQESSFNPKARSPADAFGLMQLLPEVAQAAAARAEVPFSRAEDLYDPHVNIPLGAYHLRELWDRFTGRFILAVASYNASEKSIRNWMAVRFKNDPVAFVEDIPYEETRGYIRLVMRNMIFYQLLNHPDGEIQFPDWVFNLTQDGATQ